MSQATTGPAATADSPAAVRLVLFGMPGAGKSSLLGALAQAAQAQPQVLSGTLVDRSHALADLQTRLYEKQQPGETPGEIVSYPVTLEPAGATPLEAVLVDCDGRVANDLMGRQQPIDEANTLARAVLEADTLILVVDAAANPAQMERDFSQFARFLGLLETSRGRRSDVGGLPVYLVLTKCDLLAQPNDTAVSWIDRIEERKRQVGLRFRDFLARPTDAEHSPFGSIDLHLWATAVKRPALADTPARPREPYGVAELFRQCLDSARRFDEREDKAHAQLRWTLFGSLGLVLFMALLASYFFLIAPGKEPSALEQQVDKYRSHDQAQSVAERFRELDKKLAELQTIKKDQEGFAALPAEKQAYVDEQIRRLRLYRDVYGKFTRELREIMQPRDATSEEQLQQIEESLEKLQPPPELGAEWRQTPAGQVSQEWRRDIAAIRKAVARAENWYRKLLQDGRKVLDDVDAPNLPARAKKVLDEAKSPPFPDNNPDKELPGSATATYETVYKFTSVAEARDRWDEVRQKLQNVAKLGKS